MPWAAKCRAFVRRVRRAGAWILLPFGLLAAGCGEATASTVAAPVAVDTSQADASVAEQLLRLLATARAAPMSAPMRGRLAMAYEVNGFPDAALATYVQAQALAPDDFSYPYFAALLLARKGDVDAALVSLDEALAIDPEYVPAWLWRGAWLLDEGRLDDAESVYRRADQLGAGSPAAAGLAQVALHRGEPQRAAALLEPANAALRHPHLYRMLGRAYRQLGREEDARIAFARGRPATPLAWRDPMQNKKVAHIIGFRGQLAHAQKLLRSEQNQEALKMLEPWQRLHGEDAALLGSLGWAYMNMGDLERALDVMRRGVERHPEDRHFHFNLARLHRRTGDLQAAEQHLAHALRLSPADTAAFEELGRLRMEQDRPDGALAAFASAIEHGARNAAQLAQASGLIEGARGRWTQSIAHFQDAAERDPSLTTAYLHLARSLAEAGRFVKANGALEWAERLDTHRRETASAKRRVAALQAAANGDQT